MSELRFPIGTKIKLINNKENIEYFDTHFRGYDPFAVYIVESYHPAPNCIYLNIGKQEGINYTRFKKIDELPEELFEI